MEKKKEKAYNYFMNGETGKAKRLYKSLAMTGDPESQFYYGRCLWNYEPPTLKEGITEYESMIWFKKAAEQGYVPAMIEVAESYRDGFSVREDMEQAARYYKMVPLGDYPFIETRELMNIGDNFNYGLDQMPKDHEEAIKWYTMASVRGCAEADYELGLCHLYSWGCEENDRKALRFLKRAAKAGCKDALGAISQCYWWAWGVSQDCKVSTKWHLKASEAGYAEAMYPLVLAYLKGHGVAVNKEKAAFWLEKYRKHYILNDWQKKHLTELGLTFD